MAITKTPLYGLPGDRYVVQTSATAGPTVGTTAPEWVFKCPASVRRIFSCTPGSNFATNLSLACVTTGGTAGTTSPTNAVTVRLLLDV